MEYVITVVGGDSFIVPDSAVPTQRLVLGDKFVSALPVGVTPPSMSIPSQLPSAVPVDFSKMGMKELQDWADKNGVPVSKWKEIKNLPKLRKILKDHNDII